GMPAAWASRVRRRISAASRAGRKPMPAGETAGRSLSSRHMSPRADRRGSVMVSATPWKLSAMPHYLIHAPQRRETLVCFGDSCKKHVATVLKASEPRRSYLLLHIAADLI